MTIIYKKCLHKQDYNDTQFGGFLMIIDVCFQWTDLFSTGDAICNMVDNYYNIM